MMVKSTAFVLLLAAGGLAGCSATVIDESGPGWSLAETNAKSSSAVKGLPTQAAASLGDAAPAVATGYNYRGGRDPATGKADIAEGPAGKPDTPPNVRTVKSQPIAAAAKPITKPASPAPAAAASAGAPAASQSATVNGRVAIVAKGDTLHGISLKNGVSVKTIMTANNLASSKIFPGQKLIIPETQ
jgi:LysM repeat protein